MNNKTKDKINLIAKNILKDLSYILPIFFVVIIISVVSELYIPDEMIQTILGENTAVSIFIATLAGAILPFPSYSAYPFADFLHNSGAYIGAIFAFISSQMIVGNLFEHYLEIKYFSTRFWLLRFIVSFILIFIGGLIIEFIL